MLYVICVSFFFFTLFPRGSASLNIDEPFSNDIAIGVNNLVWAVAAYHFDSTAVRTAEFCQIRNRRLQLMIVHNTVLISLMD
jgi:hypothetical protein